MEITICTAISKDGFITDKNGGTDWVQDWDLYEKTCKEYGCVVMGRSTYEEGGSEFEGVQHIVLTTRNDQPKKESVHFVSSVDQAVTKAMQLGFKKLLVVGGAKTNEAFMCSNMVKKVFIDEHDITLGSGLKPFGDFTDKVMLKLISSKNYPEFVHKEYEVTK